MSLPAEFPRRPFSSADVRRMVEAGILGETEHVELIDGELILTPPQGPEHASLTTKLAKRLQRAYGDDFDVRVAMPLQLGENTDPEPDLAVVRDVPASRHPRGDEAALVIEVAQTSYALEVAKAPRYARAGVPVYWIVDVANRRIEIYTDPISGEARYVTKRVLTGALAAELPGLTAQWLVADLFEGV